MRLNNFANLVGVGILAVFLSCSGPAVSQAQQCNAAIYASTPSARFSVTNYGDVLDRHTRLQWARCSVGQKWNAKQLTCDGTPKLFTWRQAKELVQQKQTWRLPSIHELSSIVELGCDKPAINLKVFPRTPGSHYWSDTPFINAKGHYWLVQFQNGENHTDSGKQEAFVRLLRNVANHTSDTQGDGIQH